MENKNNLKSWEVTSQVLKMLTSRATAGVTTKSLDLLAEKMILDLGAVPINKGYQPNFVKTPYPFATCIGVNESICHGWPNEYVLREGDLCSFDLGVKKDGLCGDAAVTIGIGAISRLDQRLLEATKASLYAGVMAVKAGVEIKEVSYAIESTAIKHGYVTNRVMMGHGIGESMHMAPNIPSYFDFDLHGILVEGQMICLEPMLTKKDHTGRFLNEWCLVTRDGKKSCLMEHMLKVTKEGCEILTNHI